MIYTKGKMIQVLLVNKQELMRMGIKAAFLKVDHIEVVGELNHFAEAIDFMKHLTPDVIVLDVDRGNDFDFAAINQLSEAQGKVKILVLSGSNDPMVALAMLKQGAVGFVWKQQSAEILIKAVQSVFNGELWIHRETTALLYNELNAKKEAVAPKQFHKLTKRELSIAELAAQGIPAKKIGLKLDISDKTVRNQLVQIYSKLGVSGQLELTAKANQLGLQVEESLDTNLEGKVFL